MTELEKATRWCERTKRYRAHLMKERYKKNPQLTAAAKTYARKRAILSLIGAPILVVVFCSNVLKNVSGEAIIPVTDFVGLIALVSSLLSSLITYKKCFQKKVWELGEEKYGYYAHFVQYLYDQENS